MHERAQGALLLAVGGVAVRLGLSGAALNYIRAEYVPLLVVAGAIIAVLGVVTLARALRAPAPADGEADALAGGSVAGEVGTHVHEGADVAPHAHAAVPAADGDADGTEAAKEVHVHGDVVPRIGWMLAAPLFAVLLVAPPPLGSFAANRQSGVVVAPTAAWPPLPAAEDGAVPLTLGDYASRALYDTDLSLDGTDVRLTGFVSEVADDGFTLTRFALSCCAADGTAINVRVRTDDPPPAVDEWVVVEGRWAPVDGHVIGELTTEAPVIEAETLTRIEQPTEPYEA